MFVSIRKTYPHQARRRVASCHLGLEPLATAKMLVLVDADVDVHDPAAVWSRVGENVHPGRDVFFHTGPGDMAEHSIPVPGVGQSLALDATAKLPAEHPRALAGSPSGNEPDANRAASSRAAGGNTASRRCRKGAGYDKASPAVINLRRLSRRPRISRLHAGFNERLAAV